MFDKIREYVKDEEFRLTIYQDRVYAVNYSNILTLTDSRVALKVGDVIIEADGTKITTMNELNELKNKHAIGDTMKLKINRDGQEKEITLTLGEQK